LPEPGGKREALAVATEFVDRIAIEWDAAAGASDSVLMIHGLGGTSNTWTPILDGFRRFAMLRFDLPGSGRSARVEGPLSIARFVTASLRVLAAKGLERAHVAAHSLGTIVALHLAADQPKLVRSLALFGPLLAPPDPARTAIRARGEKLRREGVVGMQEVADALVQVATSAETRQKRQVAAAFVRESLMRQDPEGYARTCDALAEAVPADASRIHCPTLLVTGEEDVVAPPQAVRALGAKIADAQVEVLRGCGHWEPVEKPEECISLLQRFYARRM
jgi:pimeloyl-ACP methyl ester carboxylesterase